VKVIAMAEISEESAALAKSTSYHTSASASVLTALIDALIRHGVLSPQTVETEVLDGLQKTFQSIDQSPVKVGTASEDDLQEALKARATLRLVAEIRSNLFDPE
jgi:hypothetical protein